MMESSSSASKKGTVFPGQRKLVKRRLVGTVIGFLKSTKRSSLADDDKLAPEGVVVEPGENQQVPGEIFVEQSVNEQALEHIYAYDQESAPVDRSEWQLDLQYLTDAADPDEFPKHYFYGRGEEEKIMLQIVLSDHENGSNTEVIRIIGDAGAGKTALAGLIFFNHKVVRSFDFRVWVTIPYEASVCMIANKILEAVTEDDDYYPSDDFDHLLTELGKRLEEKKFLLVLDSCWIKKDDSDNWDKLITYSEGARGSVIILTARPVEHDKRLYQKFVVPPAGHILELGRLSPEDCWSIIWKRPSALGEPEFHKDLEVERVATEIANEFGNLPLVAKMIGSLLRNKTGDECKGALNNKILTTRDQGKFQIPSFLHLCYLDLPSDISKCFEYLSIFPKGYEFTQKQVVLLWMAHGILQNFNRSGKSMEEVGDKCFHYLLNRSFLQPLVGGVSFRMHNLVHDLASYTFGESCNHHLAYYGSIGDFPNKCLDQHANLLKTVLPLGRSRPLQTEGLQKIMAQLSPQVLRVLSLSHHDINDYDLPPSIGGLSHLAYLDLSHTALKALPDSICDLCNLQTLLLTNCRLLRRLPDRMNHLISLCYLDLSQTEIQELPDSICDLYSLQTLLMTNCSLLTSFPRNMSNLTNLCCLDIKGTDVREMPLQMKILTSLRTLNNFIVSATSPRFEDLGGLSNLNTLTISKLENVVSPHDAFDAKLNKKNNLQNLVLQWSRCYDHMDNECQVLEILEPPCGIRRLTIEYYGGSSFPSWVGNDSFSTLQLLKLRHCKNCTSLPPLGQLPFLKDLVIEGFNEVSFVGHEFYGNTTLHKAFIYLESLQFQEMLEWKEWNNLENAEFPCLRELSILCCPKLVQGLPKQLLSLEKLEIFGCYDLVAALPETPSTCQVFVGDSNETLMKSSAVGDFQQVALCRQVLIPKDGIQFPPQAYTVVPETRESRKTSVEGREETIVPPNVDSSDTTGHFKTETSSSDGTESSFEMLRISKASELKNLPPKLDGLEIQGCKLQDDLLQGFTTLKELYLVDCYSLRPLLYIGFLSSLSTLYICNCETLIEFPSSSDLTQKFKSLEHLCIGNRCDPLHSLTLNIFPKLKSLCVWDCPNLVSLDISDEFQGDLISLESLEISGCPNLKSLPKRGLPTPRLSSLLLSNCENLNDFSIHNKSLSSLHSLVLQKCPALESTSLAALPSSLTLLSISHCNKLTPQEGWELNNLESLNSLEIEGGCIGLESFPEEKLLPSNINTLRISTLRNLKKLDYKGFEHLNALQTLEISSCNKLQYLPEKGLPFSLTHLSIEECPLLTSKLSSMAGKEWAKIAHIPHIKLDDNMIPEHWSIPGFCYHAATAREITKSKGDY